MSPKDLKLTLTIFFFLLLKSISGQSINFKIKEIGTPLFEVYDKEDYQQSGRIYGAALGPEGMISFAHSGGLMLFDGQTWSNYKDSDDNYIDIATGADGNTYIITRSDYGYYHPNLRGQLEFRSLKPKTSKSFNDTGNLVTIERMGSDIVMRSLFGLLRYNMEADTVLALSTNSQFTADMVLDDDFLIIEKERGLMTWSKDGLMSLPLASEISGLNIIRMARFADKEILLISESGGLFVYDFKRLRKLETPVSGLLSNSTIKAVLNINDQYYAIGTEANGVIIIDKTGKIIQKLDKSVGLPDDEFRDFFLDENNNLWIAYSFSIVHVMLNSPFSTLNKNHGIDGITLGIDKANGNIYMATSNGVYFKNEQEPWQGLDNYQPFKKVKGLDHWASILVVKDNNQFVGHTKGLSQIVGDRAISLYEGEALTGEGFAYENEDRLIFGGSQGNLHLFEKRQGDWRYISNIQGFNNQIDFVEDAGDGHIWVTDSGSGVFKLKLNDKYDSVVSVKQYGVNDGLPSLERNRVYIHKKGPIFTTTKGIYRYDQNKDRFEPDLEYNDLLRNDYVVRFTELENGNISAYPSGKNVVHLKKSGNGFVKDSTIFKRLEVVSVEVIASLGSNDAWYGFREVLHYDSDFSSDFSTAHKATIRKVQITNKGDSLVFGGHGKATEPRLEPYENAIRFEFSSTFFDAADQVVFQSCLDGLGETWSNWTAEHVRNYTNLSHGNYTLKVRAKDIYGQISEIGTYTFTIMTPWYLSLWAYILYGIIIVLMIRILLKWNSRRLQHENESLEKLIQERTYEISEQANEIRRQKERAEEDKGLIEEQKNRLQELDKVKSRFFANISHELRTPLTLINAPLESLINTGKINDPEVMQTLETASRNGVSLLSLVEEILDLAKLDAGKLELVENPTRLGELIVDILKSYKDVLASKSIHLKFHYQLDQSMAIMLDERKYDKIIRNLLSNALKFTPSGGQISVTIEAVEIRGKQMFRTTVSDTGEGIHQDDLPHVFDRYYQSEQPSKKAEGGTGIGLALAKELCELFGGSISTTSELGKGTTFVFDIPLISVEQKTIVPLRLEETSKLSQALQVTIEAYNQKFEVQKPVLLITEDHPEMRAFIAQTLTPYFEIKQAGNGAVALEILKKENIDIVISDVMMPIMDGFELLEEIKRDEALHQVSVIMLTARADHEDKLYALTLGIDDYLTKPFNASEFLARIKNILENRIKIIRELKGLETSSQNPNTFDLKGFIKKYDLSEREIEVMRLMAQRKNNAQIAEALFVSQNTVKFHLKNIYGKLGISSRLEAVEFVRPLA